MTSLAAVRERYWRLRRDTARLGRLASPGRAAVAREAVRTLLSHSTGGPRHAQALDHEAALRSAIAWLLRAQDATPDAGVSLGYFPCDPDLGWRPSYPETTGYIIQTLLDHAARSGDRSVFDRAIRAAEWETRIQMPSGAVQGGPVCPPEQQRAAVFNTGMVLQGYTAAYRATGRADLLAAGRRAADFLVADLGPDGHFKTHGVFVTARQVKTYNVLCAWAMVRFGEDASEPEYIRAALRNAEAAAAMQQDNGWFAENDLDTPDMALTHTIGYTLQGLLEVGACTGRDHLIETVRRGVEPILGLVARNGYLAGRFGARWERRSRSCCLTGSAQIAIVLYRLYQIDRDARYLDTADRLVDFLVRVQRTDSTDANLNGAIAGSYPLFGEYMTGGYPNWATKYFADALMLRAATRSTEQGSR